MGDKEEKRAEPFLKETLAQIDVFKEAKGTIESLDQKQHLLNDDSVESLKLPTVDRSIMFSSGNIDFNVQYCPKAFIFEPHEFNNLYFYPRDAATHLFFVHLIRCERVARGRAELMDRGRR